MSVLAVDALVAGYSREEQILKGASIRVGANEIVAIIGPNGAGKSTLLKTIAGLLPVQSGRIAFNDIEITAQDCRQRARNGIAFVPQERNVFATLSIAENLAVSAFLDADAARKRADELYARYPMLAQKRNALARTLSGGQRQILAMAMGLMTRPKLMLLDEPTAGLSPKAAEDLFATIVDLNAAGLPILMVEQHALEALAISTHGYVLAAGANRIEGSGPELAADPEIRRLFLGG